MNSRTIITAILLTAISSPLWADVTSESTSGASSNSGAVAGGGAGGGGGTGIGLGGTGIGVSGVRVDGMNMQMNQKFEGTDLSESVPNTFPSRLTSSYSGSCIGSWSAGGSVAGFGLSGGKTIIDDACVRRENASALSALGLTDIAMEVMCQGPDVYQAAARSAKRLGKPSVCAGQDPDSKEYDPMAVTTYGAASSANMVPVVAPAVAPAPEQMVRVDRNGNGHAYVNPFFTN